jgi:hypothetical protein
MGLTSRRVTGPGQAIGCRGGEGHAIPPARPQTHTGQLGAQQAHGGNHGAAAPTCLAMVGCLQDGSLYLTGHLAQQDWAAHRR